MRSEFKNILEFLGLSLRIFLSHLGRQLILFICALLVSIAALIIFTRGEGGVTPLYLVLLVVLVLYHQVRRLIFFNSQVRLNVRFLGYLAQSTKPGKPADLPDADPGRKKILLAAKVVRSRLRPLRRTPLEGLRRIVFTARQINDQRDPGGGQAGLPENQRRILFHFFLRRLAAIFILAFPFLLLSFLLGLQLDAALRPMLFFLAAVFVLFLMITVVDPLIALMLQARFRAMDPD